MRGTNTFVCRPLTDFAIVVMGVSGSGKSTVAPRIAERLGCPFIEGDNLHSRDNVERMRAGIALDDDSRRPWLEGVGDALNAAINDRHCGVASCSALKRRYRDQIRVRVSHPVLFIWLSTSRKSLALRVSDRAGHYMPASLLDDQIAVLEPPEPDECSIELDTSASVSSTVCEALFWIENLKPKTHIAD